MFRCKPFPRGLGARGLASGAARATPPFNLTIDSESQEVAGWRGCRAGIRSASADEWDGAKGATSSGNWAGAEDV